jgi:hypothetical protein
MSKTDNKKIAIETISKMLDKYCIEVEKLNLDFVIQQIIVRLA